MKLIAVFLIAVLTAVAHGFPSRIVGGSNADIEKYPYQVSIRRYGRHICGGSIINKRNILTASHCITFWDSVEGITVHVGTTFLNQTGDEYQAEAFLYHDMFNPYLRVNDIGIVRVKKDIKFTKKVQPVQLATTDFATEGQKCVVTGWGRLAYEGEIPNNLQQVELRVESQKKCADIHVVIKDTHICTYTKKGEGTCHGDSGGPLVANGVQIGVLSFGDPCAMGSPDVYTRVYAYQDWIKQNTKLLNSTKF